LALTCLVDKLGFDLGRESSLSGMPMTASKDERFQESHDESYLQGTRAVFDAITATNPRATAISGGF